MGNKDQLRHTCVRTLAMSAAVLCMVAYGGDEPLVLARRGSAGEYSIRVPEGASSNLVHAARELSRYVEQLTGVALPVSDCATASREIRLAVKPGLGHDAFLFRTSGENLYIVGNDERAVLFGVYDFLETYGDCDWLTPDQEFVPRQELVQVPRTLDRICRPAFRIRDCYYSDARQRPDFAAKLKLNEDDPFDQVLWKCHTFMRLMPPETYYKEHPEYYALVNGERKKNGWRVNLCLTNPDVLRIERAGSHRKGLSEGEGVRRVPERLLGSLRVRWLHGN